MKTSFFTLVGFFLLACGLAACQSAAVEPTQTGGQATGKSIPMPSGEPVKIGAQDAGKTITVKAGDTLVVALEGNVTTGYNWIPAAQNPVLLNQMGEAEVTPESNRIGAPGTITLQFKAVAQGQTVLHLDYMRSWEKDVAPVKTFEVTVVAK